MPPKKKKKPAHAQPASATGSGPTVPVRIRMYRQGLGDCFLVTFDPAGKKIHMLIDCGSLGAKTTGVKLSEVVADIRSTTGDHLHLLVVTHEHKDHVCGFHDVQDAFKKITVDNVWLAWTEDPDDSLAKTLAKPEDLALALTHAAKALSDAGPTHRNSVELGKAIKDIIGFSGDPDALGAADFAKTVNEAMDFARKGYPSAKTQFHKPGQPPLEPAWLPGFRFYVLGPPYSEKALNDTGEKGSAELYGLAARLQAGAVAASGASVDPCADEADMPFDIRFRIQAEDRLVATSLAGYFSEEQEWRRIDYDWLHAAADLALQLDSITNNTSLALAIERISDRRVFLFPADAQQGNWLSWHDPAMKWTVKEGQANREVSAADLLDRTVFYKVGHHSSHNATARGKGLEMMKRADELIAFIPVDRAVALGRNPKGSWKMPAFDLYRNLLEKCQGRVLRSDIGWADDSKKAADRAVEEEFDKLAAPADWVRWRAAQAKVPLKQDRLYFEITVG
jgi:hypothetical protein